MFQLGADRFRLVGFRYQERPEQASPRKEGAKPEVPKTLQL